MINAVRYLDKAGTSPEAIYAIGVCAFLTGNLDDACEMMEKALDLGIEEAAEVLAHMNENN